MRIALYLGMMFVSLFAQEANLPIQLNAWKSLSYVGAAKTKDALPHALIEVGKASYVGLHSTPKVKYVARPTNEGGTVSYGGIFQVEIKESGTYRVVLGNASWVDLIKDGKAAQSIAHNEGPKDSGIRKMVDYPLEPGIYTLQLSAGGDSATAILIARMN